MRRGYGLLGETLKHSYSPLIYRQFGMNDYKLYEIAPDDVEDFVRNCGLLGLNVTIPYKKTVLPLCDTLTDVARRLGNVNTLRFGEDGTIHGDNTDYAGFVYLLRRAGINPRGKKALVLGAGGSGQTAALALSDLGAHPVVMISRRGDDNYENLDRHFDAQVIVNATPVGMYPNGGTQPIGLAPFERLEGAVDLIYNPLRTKFLREAAARGVLCEGGLSMLAGQGRASVQIFLGRPIAERETERIFTALLREVENIVLIGMPGCGKSAVGEAVAARLGRKLADTDRVIAETTGESPAQIIGSRGEAAFRAIETAALSKLCGERALVIATGGGAVLRPENRTAMRQNGRVYWIDRPLRALAIDNRPLSTDLPALYEARKAAYASAADAKIDADRPVEAVADAIVKEFYEHTAAQRP